MADPSSTTSTTPAGSRLRLGALISRALRAAVILVILVTGVLLVQTYRAILHDEPARPEKASGTVAGREDHSPADMLADAFLQPGSWSLGESGWTVTVMDPATAEGEARLRSLGFRGEIKDKPSPWEESVLAWLHGSRPTIVEGCRIYDRAAGVVRIRAVTRTERGKERLQLVQGTWKRGGASQMLEGMPAIGTGRVDTEHLLPLPSGVPSLARRWSPLGMLTCEILGPTEQLEQALKVWDAAGWSEERRPEGDASSPLRILRNGDRIVRLFSMQAGPQGSGDYLLLTTESSHQPGAN